MVRMSEEDTRITVRLPADLAEALRERARAEDRSLNREILFLLRQALFPPVEADAYRDRRGSIGALKKYEFPRPLTRRPRGDADS
jgi:hypothetical protein